METVPCGKQYSPVPLKDRLIATKTHSLRKKVNNVLENAKQQMYEWTFLINKLDNFAKTVIPLDSCIVQLTPPFEVGSKLLRLENITFDLPRKNSLYRVYRIPDLRDIIIMKKKDWQELVRYAYQMYLAIEKAAFLRQIFQVSIDTLEQEYKEILANNLSCF